QQSNSLPAFHSHMERFYASAVEQVLAEHPQAVIDCGAGHRNGERRAPGFQAGEECHPPRLTNDSNRCTIQVAEQVLQSERAGSSEPPMSTKTKHSISERPKTTPTFMLELPLQVNSQQARHLCGHFEAARHLYNALLGEAMKRLRRMRAESRWQEA